MPNKTKQRVSFSFFPYTCATFRFQPRPPSPTLGSAVIRRFGFANPSPPFFQKGFNSFDETWSEHTKLFIAFSFSCFCHYTFALSSSGSSCGKFFALSCAFKAMNGSIVIQLSRCSFFFERGAGTVNSWEKKHETYTAKACFCGNIRMLKNKMSRVLG